MARGKGVSSLYFYCILATLTFEQSIQLFLPSKCLTLLKQTDFYHRCRRVVLWASSKTNKNSMRSLFAGRRQSAKSYQYSFFLEPQTPENRTEDPKNWRTGELCGTTKATCCTCTRQKQFAYKCCQRTSKTAQSQGFFLGGRGWCSGKG